MFNQVGQFSVAVDTQLWKYSNGPTTADHAFHEFSSLRLATENEIASLDLWGDTSVLLNTFRLASKQLWDCSQSVPGTKFLDKQLENITD